MKLSDEILRFINQLKSGQKRSMTNTSELPQFVADCMEFLHGSHAKPSDNEYSTTTLLKGTKEIILSRRHSTEISEDVQDSASMVAGTAVHAMLQTFAEEDNLICEQPVIRKRIVNGKECIVSGRFDFYDPETGTLYDLKDTKVATYQKNKDGREDKWVKQLVSYALCLEEQGYAINRLCIIAIITDHSKVKASIDPDYPQSAITTIYWDWKALNDFKNTVLDVQYDKLLDIDKCNKLKDDEIPPCTPEERFEAEHWSVHTMTKAGTLSKVAKKNFDTESEAIEFSKTIPDSQVVHKQGTSLKCLLYCSCKDFCNFYKENVMNKETKDESITA